MSFITKRRLASMASASALIATMAVAAVPGATLAANCTPTGFVRDGIDLTAAQKGGAVTGELDASGCDIGVYNPTSVTNADIHGARYYGVVVNGLTNVNTTNSKIHDIGDQPVSKDNPMVGMQRGRAITYINGASGTISGNQVFAFQKNGIEVIGLNAAGTAPSVSKTTATVQKNVVTGLGLTSAIAQNGIVVRHGGSATVQGNTVSDLWYTPIEASGLADDDACGLLILEASRVTASTNTYTNVEYRVYTEGQSKGHVVKP